MLATILKSPEMEIEEAEAAALANAVEAVQRCYSRQILSPEAAAWLNLGIAAAAVYGPRVIAIRNRRAAGNAKPVVIHATQPAN